jgi:hypothetical protein
MRCTLAALFIASLLLPPATAQDLTTRLDAFITAPDGGVPKDLTAGDLTLKVGGRPQQIDSVELLATGPRYIQLVVDESTLYALEPVAREAIAQLLGTLGAGDLVGYFSTKLKGTRIGFTRGYDRITAAANALKGGPGVLWPCQTDLMTLIGSLAGDLPQGRSTTIAVLSRGHPDGPAREEDPEAGPCTPRREDLQKLSEALSVAQVNLHLFTVDETKRSWGFDSIAGNTGATSGLLTWASTDGLARAIQSTPRPFRLTFEWNAPRERAQRVELRAADRSLKIRTSSVLSLRSR